MTSSYVGPGRPENPAETERWERGKRHAGAVPQECPSRAVHDPHTHLGGAAVCPGVEAPPADKSWLDERAQHVRAPQPLPPAEVCLLFLAQLLGAALTLLCLHLPAPWGLPAFLLINAAIVANMARILLKGRRRPRHL